MWKALLLVAAALGFLWWVGSMQQVNAQDSAPPSGMSVKPFPMPCADADQVKAELEEYTLVFEGVLNRSVLYSLYVKDNGQFIMSMQTTIFPDICFVAAGEEHNLIGIIAPKQEQEGRGS
jgi:hypothetical protein